MNVANSLGGGKSEKDIISLEELMIAVADQGFPVGGRGPRRGDVDSRRYVKTKESGPLGGRVPGMPPLNPPMDSTFHDTCLKK